MAIENLHEGVGLAGMIDVMRAIAATAAIQAPACVDCTDAQSSAVGTTLGFSLRDPLARVLRYFPSCLEVRN